MKRYLNEKVFVWNVAETLSASDLICVGKHHRQLQSVNHLRKLYQSNSRGWMDFGDLFGAWFFVASALCCWVRARCWVKLWADSKFTFLFNEPPHLTQSRKYKNDCLHNHPVCSPQVSASSFARTLDHILLIIQFLPSVISPARLWQMKSCFCCYLNMHEKRFKILGKKNCYQTVWVKNNIHTKSCFMKKPIYDLIVATFLIAPDSRAHDVYTTIGTRTRERVFMRHFWVYFCFFPLVK